MRKFDFQNSYLQIYFPHLDLDYVSVYESSAGELRCLRSFMKTDSGGLSCLVILMSQEDGQIFFEQLRGLLAGHSPEFIHVLFEPVTGRWGVLSRLWYMFQVKTILL